MQINASRIPADEDDEEDADGYEDTGLRIEFNGTTWDGDESEIAVYPDSTILWLALEIAQRI